MSRQMVILLLLVGCAFEAYAVPGDVGPVVEETGVDLSLPDGIGFVPFVEQEDVTYQVAYKYLEEDWEVRMSFFPESHLGDSPVPAKDFSVFSYAVLLNIAQGEDGIVNISALEEADVAREFNADAGFTAILHGDRSQFAKGYTYVMVNGFLKIGAGMTFLHILFSDIELLQQEIFMKAFYSFRFR